jgi:hypothetical protein
MLDYQKIQDEFGARGDFPSCFAFSVHKAGSTLMNKMIQDVCIAQSIPCAHLPRIMFHEGLLFQDWSTDAKLLDYFSDGRVYIGFRALPPFLGNSELVRRRKSVLLVRDPRDALVSQYYSFGGRHLSHALPDKNPEQFASLFNKSSTFDLDTYVLAAAQSYRSRLMDYHYMMGSDNVLLRRYEDVYFDKFGFLKDVFAHFEFDVPLDVLAKVAKQHDVRPVEERVGAHIRKGLPGDHVEKLAPATIARLNQVFAEACRDFGYDLEAPAAR